MSSIIELQLAKEAALKEIEDAAIRAIEEKQASGKGKGKGGSNLITTNRTEYQLEKRRLQAKRARAKKKEIAFLTGQFIEVKHKPEREYKSVLIKKPIEAVDRFKRIL